MHAFSITFVRRVQLSHAEHSRESLALALVRSLCGFGHFRISANARFQIFSARPIRSSSSIMAANNTAKVTLDISGLGEVVKAAVEQSLAAAQASRDNMANQSAAPVYDIAGLREQILGEPCHVSGLTPKLTVILENVRVLYPATVAKSHPSFPSILHLQVVTRTVGSEVSAHVLHNCMDTDTIRDILISGEHATSAGEALEKLLKLTESMLDDIWADISQAKTGKWTKRGPDSGFNHFKHLVYDGM